MKKTTAIVIFLLGLIVILLGVYTANQPPAVPTPTPTSEQPPQSLLATAPAPALDAGAGEPLRSLSFSLRTPRSLWLHRNKPSPLDISRFVR